MRKFYEGFIVLDSYGEADDILFLCSTPNGRDSVADWDDDCPLADKIQGDIEEYGNFLTVKYFISQEAKTWKEARLGHLEHLYGVGDVDYGDAYSEITGYLWTDEEIKVGGHDLLEELRSNKGKYCILSIVFSQEGKTTA